MGSNPAVGHGCLSVVSVVCCAGRGLCDGLIIHPGDPTVCMCVCVCVCVCVHVSTCVIRCDNNPLHLRRVARRDPNVKSENTFIATTHSKLVKIREKLRKWKSEGGGKCRPMYIYTGPYHTVSLFEAFRMHKMYRRPHR